MLGSVEGTSHPPAEAGPTAPDPADPGVRAVVGIGASAGGLVAFGRFLKALPLDSGLAFVLVQHLDPAFPSELAHILSSTTRLRVTDARDGEPVQANHVYVLPSGGLLTLVGGRLRVAQRSDGHPLVIDRFLTSLAADRGAHAIAVILSGSGSDGVEGALAVKAAGGTTFAQDPDTAEHGDMPRNAIESGAIDYVLAPEEIARAVLNPTVRRPKAPTPPASSADGEAFEEIREILHAATGVDFRHYKPSTLRRRMDRRLIAHGLGGDLPGYAALLRRDSGAVAALYQDVLLHVTGFFRDPVALDALQANVLPDLLATCHANRPCRVWVPGCASGEEVYSIAICLLEAKAAGGGEFPIQIFGTDLSDSVLDAARRARYPATIARDVSAERLNRFFVRTGEGYQLGKRVRELCTFSQHDVTRDPPFSRMDLISCRNVLIYFDTVLQARVLRVFHYALNPGGLLMLGPAESPGMVGELFSLRDPVAKVHVRHAGPARLPSAFGLPGITRTLDPEAAPRARRQLSSLDQAVTDAVATGLAAPGVVVSSELDILQFRGRTAPWLTPPAGEPTAKLLKMVHPDLRVPVGRVVRKALRQGGPGAVHGLRFITEGREQWVTVRVLPVPWGESDQPCFLLVFEPLDGRFGASRGTDTDAEGASEQVAELQRELVETRDYLQALLDEQDRAHAELQAAHEDSLSVNEEFQSTNEELVTTKEEIQSINEELTTLNDELRRRNTELHALNSDLANVLESVDIPVIICDRELRLRRFSPKAGELFQLDRLPPHARLTEGELPLGTRELEELCRTTLRDERLGSAEVRDRKGRWHQLRVLPYRDDGRTVGVVLALVDIDNLQRAMDSVSRARDYSAAIVESVRHPMIVLSGDLTVISANGQFWRKFRLDPDIAAGTSLSDLPGDLWNAPELRERINTLQQSGDDFDDLELAAVVPDAGRRLFRISARKLVPLESHLNHILVAVEDVTDRHLLEERVNQAAKLQAMGQLAGGVAHEINNQMQIAMGFGRDLLQDMPAEDPRRPDVEHILTASARSADVTHSLLAFSRQQLMRPELVSVDDLVDGMARLLPRLVGPAVEIVTSTGAGRRLVYADRAQLEQVFVNLALNANDAMPRGGRLFMETSMVMVDDEYGRRHGGIAVQPGPHVRIVIRDRGQGMDPATLARVFEPFFTTKPVGKGSGLGMASVYGTVKQSGGYVWVESRPGEGATVTIDLPERIDARETPRKASGPSQESPGGTETILVVDDVDMVGSWVARALETLGYVALVAGDGGTAVRMVQGGAQPDLLLTDVVMPRMGGRELAALLEQLRPGIRVLYMSGHTKHEMIDRGLLDEHAPFLSKPFSIELLAGVIRATLDGRPAQTAG